MAELKVTGRDAVPGQPTPGFAPLQAGGRLGDYEIVEPLNRGTQGTVYAARHVASGAKVALKYSGTDADRVALLRREAKALSATRHPNLARFREFKEADGAAYLVTEYEDGTPLDAVLAASGGRLDGPRVLGLLLPLLDGLGRLHEAGLLHRDVSPGNILVRPDGTPVLVDFGSAKAPGEAGAGPGAEGFATPGYAPPEHYAEDAAEGPWTDLYGLAAVAYRALCGKAPPDARERLAGTPMVPAVEAAAGACSEALLEALDRALRLDAHARPRSAEAWLADLPAAEAGPAETTGTAGKPEASPPDPVPETERITRQPLARLRAADDDAAAEAPVRETGRRGRHVLAIGLLALLVLALAGAGVWSWQWYRVTTRTEWTVDASGAGDTVSIAEALRRAKPGSIIRVRSGTYEESLVMDRPLQLLGDGENAPVIAPASGPCLLATAAAGTVRGFAFQGGDGSGPCLDLAGSGVTAADNRLQGWKGTAIRVRDGGHASVIGNDIVDAEGWGIAVEAGAGGTIRANTIQGSGKAGILLRGGALATVTGNHVEKSGQAGIVVGGGSAGAITENVIISSRASGIEIRGGANPKVAKNRIEGSAQAGIFVYRGGLGLISENTIVGNGFSGVVLASGAASVLTGNEIRDNGEHGVLIMDGARATLKGNRITDNVGHAIALAPAAAMEGKANELRGNKKPQVRRGRIERPKAKKAQ